MGTGWRHLAIAAGLRLGVLGLVGAIGAAALSGGGGGTAVPLAAARSAPGPGQLSSAQNLVSSRAAALARAGATARALSAALTGLRTQAEALAERYDHEVSVEQQASAAYQTSEARLAAARTSERRASAMLGRLAAAQYESAGGPSMADAVIAGITDPRGYLGSLGLQQAIANQSVDLLAARRADELVTGLFSRQAASLLAQRRSAAQAAAFLKAAVVAAVGHQAAVVRLADKTRSRLAAETGAARASEAALAADLGSGPSTVPSPVVLRPPAIAASVLAGGPRGAAPGVFAPDWASDAGATAAQGDIAADWALTQVGRPYQWGAAGPRSYDCSGLAMEAWARAGVRLLHWTGYQWVSGPHVPLADLRRGDLVFYAFNIADPATIHHVGIYLGHGLMVDAPYTGSFVRIDSIYAFPGLIGATRPAA
ncbi:MAG TPA: C40 family peptidase [Trebonia sp.]|jgi:cell wall-associated NlpC family hydrolase|nr:C40 family peptidase [Trebonia sp.]